ncbi:sulfotransferase family 2 domain-containing protein [Lysobacter silvisoli]|uniref:Sulfotransferase n=1 Tax=Lysobacter silvisoli TaxID=2293254 RepID=A0A371K6A0_9GAMM|nr:sulfotransferase family 2 domain-containing protein [Lysobacter silvisoli]RDZ29446.1 sulfotransferase [Lysobacter silvisoli]
MIISHQHRFVFAAIPKTGTHSVRQALRAHMSEQDLEQVGLFVNKRFPFEELAAIKHGHITLDQIRPFLGEQAFADYFKFAFVRNPYDRFVSYCAFMTRADGAFLQRPQSVMRYMLFEARPMQHVLFQPQHTFVTDAEGRVLADTVGRVEDMQASFDAICDRLGLPHAQLGQVNSSRRGAYRDYYDQALIDGVTELYQRDLELFGYSF